MEQEVEIELMKEASSGRKTSPTYTGQLAASCQLQAATAAVNSDSSAVDCVTPGS